MPLTPRHVLGYPNMAPPSYTPIAGEGEVSIADGDEEELYGDTHYTPMYMYAEGYQVSYSAFYNSIIKVCTERMLRLND